MNHKIKKITIINQSKKVINQIVQLISSYNESCNPHEIISRKSIEESLLKEDPMKTIHRWILIKE